MNISAKVRRLTSLHDLPAERLVSFVQFRVQARLEVVVVGVVRLDVAAVRVLSGVTLEAIYLIVVVVVGMVVHVVQRVVVVLVTVN